MTQPTIRGTVAPTPAAGTLPLLVLGPSLGTTTALWDGVAARLAETGLAGTGLADTVLTDTMRVLCFDLPGHGRSPATREPFTVSEVADAVIALVDSVGGGAFHYAGVSFGGAVGLELALRHPERLQSLAVVCSAARIGTRSGWEERAARIRSSGTPSIIAGSAERWFAPGFLDRDPAAGSAALEKLLDVDDESYALCCEALAGFDVTDAAAGIQVPTLCIAGQLDRSTPPAQLAELAASIPGARLETVTGAAHLAPLERPAEVAALLLAHLAGQAAVPKAAVPKAAAPDAAAPDAAGPDARSRTAAEAYADGMTVRRAVLGDAHVDAATAAITAETADFQDFITRYAWGEIWTRPGLDRRTRSFLTLACLVTGGHENELGMHVRAALTNGLTRAEISEAILHTAIYAGVPAANSALTVVRATFKTIDTARSS
ncbi:MAG TPA: 4-carboxymuconolactone decarboxylase [Cryobacterium sp.]|nr:4-carboxymuconolactone decarboxylase [Cryobacterium sp.]